EDAASFEILRGDRGEGLAAQTEPGVQVGDGRPDLVERSRYVRTDVLRDLDEPVERFALRPRADTDGVGHVVEDRADLVEALERADDGSADGSDADGTLGLRGPLGARALAGLPCGVLARQERLGDVLG